MSQVHDNHLMGYDVDGALQRIVLRTERRGRGGPVHETDVIFDGVEAYSFRYDFLDSILFDICEEPLEQAVQANWCEFDAGHRQSGWPRFWQQDEAKTRDRIGALAQAGAKWFNLSSSYGMSGWVLCRALEYRTRLREAPPGE
jgi:hypothetical protein